MKERQEKPKGPRMNQARLDAIRRGELRAAARRYETARKARFAKDDTPAAPKSSASRRRARRRAEKKALEKHLAEKLAIKDEQIAEKDEQLAKKDQQIAQKDQQLAELLAKDQQVAQKEGEIKILVNSVKQEPVSLEDHLERGVTVLLSMDDGMERCVFHRGGAAHVQELCQALQQQYAAMESAVDYTTDLTAQYELGFNTVNDVNFSMETAHLAKNQILQQAATAMLAQANQGQQGLLQLIQG